MLGESQRTIPKAEGIQNTVDIFNFFMEVIRTAAGIIVVSSAY